MKQKKRFDLSGVEFKGQYFNTNRTMVIIKTKVPNNNHELVVIVITVL